VYMMSFFNAGYNKAEIEEAARALQSRHRGEIPQTQVSSIKQATNIIQTHPTSQTNPVQNIVSQKQIPKQVEAHKTIISHSKSLHSPEPKKPQKPQESVSRVNPSMKKVQSRKVVRFGHKKPQQNVSSYGEITKYDSAALQKNLNEAIKSLSRYKIPSKIRVVNEPVKGGRPPIVQKISGYDIKPQKPPGKFLTFFLVFLLVLLLGVLITAFFFRKDLISLFNNIGVG